jgi:hypothetical protein
MAGVSTSIFIFKAGEAQGEKEIFSCWIKEDGLETVKNKGRMDVKGKWKDIENEWVKIIYKHSGDETIQWINPNTDAIMYKVPEKEIELFEEDFKKTIIKYKMYELNAESNFEIKDVEDYFLMLSVKNTKEGENV